MNYDVKVVGKGTYSNTFNNQSYAGFYLYATYQSESVTGVGTVSFKIPELRADDLHLDQVKIGERYHIVTSTRQYENGNRQTIVEAIYK